METLTARLRRHWPFVGLACVLLLVLLLNKLGVLAPDIKPEVYLAPWRETSALTQAWRGTQKLGEPNFNVGLFPVTAVVGLIQELGVGPDLSMRLLRWVLLLVGAWGGVRLYELVAGPRARREGGVAMALLYVANPYLVTAGDFLAIVLPAALLPWLALFLLRAAQHGGWRYPAAAALAFAGMSGMNAGVIPLIQLACLPALLWFAHVGLGVPWRAVLAAFLRWAVLALLLSAYWLVPAFAALGLGSHVFHFSESLEGIAAPSSFAEVARGLGLWPLYGGDVDGPWQPGFAPYLTNPFVVAASFAMPLLLVLSATVVRGRARSLVLLMAVPAIVLMVGVHTADDPTPFGRALLWSFENVPGAAAFRTTNKVGAVLVLGIALIGALAAPSLLRRARVSLPRPGIAAVLTVVVVLTTWPAWTGGIYSLPLPVPDYWHRATEALDAEPHDSRVWFVPGVAQPQYTWSAARPDDLNAGLLARPSFVRQALPESSPYGASLLTAVDTGLQEGTLPPGVLSSVARYLGAGDVLVRNETRWDKYGGARPATVQGIVGADPGLALQEEYGDPGQGLVRTADQPPGELFLPPLQHAEVRGARPIVRSESARGRVLVDGDGWAVAPLVQAGLLPGEPAFLLAGATSRAELPGLLGEDARIVLTDTNRRRSLTLNRLTGGDGPLLGARQDPGPTLALFGPSRQTVLEVEGGVVTATQTGPSFGTAAAWSPQNAFDHDPTTAWTFGEYGQGLGQSITVRLRTAIPVDHIDVDLPPSLGQRISGVRLDVDGASATAEVPIDGRVTVSFPQRRTRTIQLTVTTVAGHGDNPLSVAEISVPDLQVLRVARLPRATTDALRGLERSDRDTLAGTPLDVVLNRVLGTSRPGDDEESRLERNLMLADRREFRLYGLARPDAGAADPVLDRLAGAQDDVVVDSSSRAGHSVLLRGSAAFDGDPETGWSPGRARVGEWLTATFPEREVTEVVIDQPRTATGWISSVAVSIDGRQVATAALQPGRVVVPLPEDAASELRLEVLAVAGQGDPVISEVGLAETRVRTDPQAAAEECVPVATVDDQPVLARMIGGVTGDGPRLLAGCDPLVLPAGIHEVRSVPGWTLDTAVLRDVIGETPIPGAPGPALRVQQPSSTEYLIDAAASDSPYLLVVGQNLQPGWQATVDGVSLGPALPVDGYALGWWIRDPGPHEVRVWYQPQRATALALAVSGVALLGVLGLVLLGARRTSTRVRGRTAPRVAAVPRRPVRGSPGWWSWALIVLGCWVFGGLAGLAAGVAVSAWCVLRPPRPGTLLRLSVAMMALVPVAWILGNLQRWGTVTPQLVLANPLPSVLVVGSLVLLVVGSWRDDRREAVL